jgi:rhodanese-related sulfurtransferase
MKKHLRSGLNPGLEIISRTREQETATDAGIRYGQAAITVSRRKIETGHKQAARLGSTRHGVYCSAVADSIGNTTCKKLASDSGGISMRIYACSLVVVSLALAAPILAVATEPQPAAVAELLARARQEVTHIDMAAFSKISMSPGAALLIDVREPDEFAAGHIPGAINIPRGLIEFRIWPYIGYPDHTNLATELYIYCGWGSRSLLAARSLQQLGLSRVIAVDMRLADWQAAGHPLTEPDFQI